MNEGYVKLFNSILISSVWQEDDATRLLWIAMLALADKNGYVCGSVPGLAHVARIPAPSCEKALAILSAPDPHSQNPANEGRRIAAAERGWIVLNYPEWRKKLSYEDRKEYKRLKQREYRAKVSTLSTGGQNGHIQKQRQSTDTKKKSPPIGGGGGIQSRISALFGRKREWNEKELKAFKLADPKIEELDLIEAYYKTERAKGTKGHHRRDLQTFLNNYRTEVDRARGANLLPAQTGVNVW